VVRDSPKKVMDFIKDNALRRFYMIDLEKQLEDYAPGRPEMKPDVIEQTRKLEQERAKMVEDAAARGGGGGGGGGGGADGGQILLQQPGQPPVALNNQQVVEIIQKLQVDVDERNKVIDQLREEYRILQSKYELLVQRKQPEHEYVPDKEVIYM
jgi:hypothetical protein